MMQVMQVGEMIEGFINNMPDEQIDRELKLFRQMANKLKGPRYDYARLGVVMDPDHIVDDDMLEKLKNEFGYKPQIENNLTSGHDFIYFRNKDDASRAADIIDYIRITENK